MNQISLSCQANKDNENKNENVSAATIDDSPDQNSNLGIETDAAGDLPVLEKSQSRANGNAFQPDLNPTPFGIEQPVNFEEAF